MRHLMTIDLFNILGILLMRGAQEANLMITFGPSYVLTRYVMAAILAGGALLLAHLPFHGA